MTRYLLSLLATALLAAPVSAEVGISLFAINAFDRQTCRQAIRMFDGVGHPTWAVLFGTFDLDPREQCMRRLLRQCRMKACAVQIHPDFTRTRGESARKILRRMMPRVRRAVRYAERYPHVRWLLSTGLEDKFSNAVYRRVRTRVREVWHYELVRNPVGSDERGIDSSGADFIELHGPSPDFRSGKPAITNLDGMSIRTTTDSHYYPAITKRQARRYLALFSGAAIRFLWFCEHQGVCKSPVPEPNRRDFRIRAQDVRWINQRLKDGG